MCHQNDLLVAMAIWGIVVALTIPLFGAVGLSGCLAVPLAILSGFLVIGSIVAISNWSDWWKGPAPPDGT